MTWWDHFVVAEIVPTVFMAFVVVSAVGTAVVSAYLAGVRHGRRDALRAVDDMCAGFEEQIVKTVPLFTRDGGR